MRYVFKTPDHPAGVVPALRIGERSFPIQFRTDDGATLTVHIGEHSFIDLAAAILVDMREDDELRRAAERRSLTIVRD